MNTTDLYELATSSSEAERQAITDNDILSIHRQNIERLLKTLDEELYVATLAAQKTVDNYWAYVSYLYEERKDKENFSYFTVRARLDEKRNNLSIPWQKRYPVEGRSKKNRTTNSKTLSKGSGPRYKKEAFGYVRDWEYEAITAAEDKFEKIRQHVEAIGKLRRNVRALGRLVEKNHHHITGASYEQPFD